MMRASSIVVFMVAAVVALTSVAAERGKKKQVKPPRSNDPRDLQIVDCLLPGQVRRLGAKQTYISRRRPMRTTALDCEIRGGEYVAYDRADYRTALRVWLESAQEGDSRAQYFVGEIYQKGLGAPPDYEKAAEWYRRSAEQGYGPAQMGLGFLYEQGLGVPADSRQALEWYRKAAGISGVILLDSEVAAIQEELADIHDKAAEAQSALEQAEGKLTAARIELDRERDAGRENDARRAELAARVSTLEQELQDNRNQVRKLEEERRRYDVAGPSIEIIDPSAMRSLTPASPPDTHGVVGRVEAPAGLASLRAGEEPLRVEEGGLFRFEPRAGTVKLVAVDMQGKRGELTYTMGAGPESPARSGRSGTRTRVKLGNYHALLIGNSEYSSLPPVQTAESDVTALARLLEEDFGFSVTTLYNATSLEILTALGNLSKELEEKDNLLIYYAGHGELDELTGMGYWLPVDAAKDQSTFWISSREISNFLEVLPPAHILVVADSCYSGALTRSSLVRFDAADEKQRGRWIRELSERRSRTALTSGGLQPVLDTGGGGHSVFARAFLDALAEVDGTLPAYSLWTTVRAQVTLETRWLRNEQVPQYAPIQYAGHESGEFFFVRAGG